MAFPKDFLWGAATASYQIEGASRLDGRGECIWTRFSHTPGKVMNGDTGDVATDHYHRYPEDVALMRELGLDAYRFSISWPRVLPQGTGAINPAGLDFYDRLVDELLRSNITPWVTLYHWDLPQALQDRGGWLNSEIVGWFTDYTDLVTRRLADRVQNWITLNEPWVVAFVGYAFGEHAPGYTDLHAALKASHHLLLSHGASMQVIRQNVPDAKAGITLNLAWVEGASSNEEDLQAAQRHDGFLNRWFLDPVFKGEYPADMVSLYGPMLEDIDVTEVHQAAVPQDFLGINYYMRNVIKHNPDAPYLQTGHVLPPDSEYTKMNWEVYPDAFAQMLVRLHQDYAPPAIYITENGAAYPDEPTNSDLVEDPKRVAYLQGHIGAVEKAIGQGSPVKGYFVWSLLDNFEWAFGYDRRFGIIYVDFDTLKRTPKQSALWYRDFIAKAKSNHSS